MSSKKVNLIAGPIGKTLVKLTWPMVFGMLGLIIFNLTDTFYIGRLGVSELAAISFTFPVVTLINSIGQGMGIGTASLVSRSIVSEDIGKVRQYATNALLLAVIIVLTFVVLGQSTLDPVFRSLGASDQIRPLVKEYMRVWLWGVPFVVVPVVGNNIMRATGDTFTPGMIMVASAVLNAIMDPILIFGLGPIPAMGLKGAALGTVMSRALGFIAALYILIYREKLLTRSIPALKKVLETWKQILYVAAPATAGMLITPISIGVITRFISSYGKEAVASFGIVSRVEMFILMIVAALASVMTIFSGQNWGAKKNNRIAIAYRYASSFSMGWGLLLFSVCLFFSSGLAGIFSSNQHVIRVASQFLKIVSVSYGFQGIVMLSGAVLNGINKPMTAMTITLTRMLILYVPMAYIFSKFWGLTGIFWSAFIANILTGVYAFVQVNINIQARKKTVKTVVQNLSFKKQNNG